MAKQQTDDTLWRYGRFTIRMEHAEEIVEALIADLRSRGMIGEIWDKEVLLVTKEEIKQKWASIVKRKCNKFGRLPQRERKDT